MPTEPLFPNRRFFFVNGHGDREYFSDYTEAVYTSRSESMLCDGSVTLHVIENAEPIGAITFRGGRMLVAEGDCRGETKHD